MYPSFVIETAKNQQGTRTLIICGKEYSAHDYDWYIDDAVDLAKHWKPHQITFTRIVHLRHWIRENFQHGHNIPYKHITNMRDCRCLLSCIIHAEYDNAGEDFSEDLISWIKENQRVFSKREGVR